MLLLPLHLKWRVNTKQAHLIDSADWSGDEEDGGGGGSKEEKGTSGRGGENVTT